MNKKDGFGYWFSGLVDGEGCFHARAHYRKQDNAHMLVTYFSLRLRADDQPILEYIKKQLGVGAIYLHSEKLSKHLQADYRISHRRDLSGALIPLLDNYPLKSKKSRDYKTWRKIVLDYKMARRWHTRSGIRSLADKQWEEVTKLCNDLKEGRRFKRLTPKPQRRPGRG